MSALALNDAMDRRVIGQRPVSPEFVVVVGIRDQDPPQVRFARDHDTVQALSPDRADEAFDVCVLPRRSPRCCWSVPDAHGREASRYGLTIGGVSVADEVLGRLLPRVRLR
jgi:hypothetical protein